MQIYSPVKKNKMEKLTKEVAKEYAILKWKYIVENGGSSYGLIKKYPKLAGFMSCCSYCALYKNDGCAGCPVRCGFFKRKTCVNKSHPFSVWHADSTAENAKLVLDLIEKIKV